ncbi:annexin-like protein RJ4 isoform X2 [Physcomitrium patens]|uniref:Annexin n=1 Tax=Physcomitrium patens TaxID=3218 RepID=A0A7I4DMR0_PHYPA|nr:annexin-like protein RJ4 isoform X2 [Physcomitrium patens]|eukprot:XP_024373908.1 annexin-like protein RJ4 isoform X2 [Physcomitrella patens]
MGTLTLPPCFNLQEDCKELRSSLKGLGSNEKKVIEILGRRTQAQRLEIAQAYQTVYGESLHKRLKSAFSGKLESKWAFWRSSESKVKEAPKRLVSVTKLLLALVRGNRPENTPVDRHIALNDAHQLHKVVIGKGGNEDTLVRILCTRSIQQLTATFNYYHQHYGRELEQSLTRGGCGEFEQALRYTVMCYRQPAKFYAEELNAALGGAGTDDDALIRVVTTRAEVDMQYIKLEFANESKKKLEDMIANETSGNYRYFLLTLVGPGDLGMFSPRTSNGSMSFYSPRTSNGSASLQQSAGSQNGSASYYSPRSSGQGSFQM